MLGIKSFLIKLLFKDPNNKLDKIYLSSLCTRHSDVVTRLNKNYFILKNDGTGMFLIGKLIARYHPLIWIYSMSEFLEYQLPEKIKTLVEKRVYFTKTLEKELNAIKIEHDI